MEEIQLTVGDDRENSRPNSTLEGYDGVCTLDDENPVPGNVHQQHVAIYEKKRSNIATEIDHSHEEIKPTTKEKKSLAGFFTIFRMADCLDWLLMVVGVLAAILHGTTLPVTVMIFTEAVDVFVADAIAKSQLEFSRNASIATTATYTEDITTMIRPMCVRLAYWAVIIIAAGNVHVFCWKLTSERQVSRLRSQLFSAILYKDCAWFDRHNTGSLVVTITNDIVNIESGMSDKVSLFIQHLSVFVVAIIMALATSWRLSLAVLSLTPLTVVSVISIVIVTRGASARQAKAYAQAGSVATEVLSAIRTVAAFGGELKDAVRYQECLFSARKVGIIKGLLTGCGTGAMWFGNFSMFGLAIWYGTSLIGSGASGGNVVFVLMVIISAAISLGQSLPNLGGVATAGGSAVTIFQIIDTDPQIRSLSEEGLKPECLLGNVEFEKVEFAYETRPEIKVLDEVKVRIEAGQTVALVGPSGSGKSTLCYLLLRLYDCTAGRVTVDGHDIKDINVKWLRQQIGVVSQEPVLFDGSISDNIRLGREVATQTDIEDASKMANAHDFIMEFPDTYDTLVGERGTQMSGGQKQRIAIARALISNPKILLLDEATSALDSESETLVQDALDKARQGRTTVIIAHRLSTIRNADVIHCLSGGRVVECGSHDELMIMKGLYHDLVVSQVELHFISFSPPGLSTEVGRLPACPPRWVVSRLVHRGGSPWPQKLPRDVCLGSPHSQSHYSSYFASSLPCIGALRRSPGTVWLRLYLVASWLPHRFT
ncbi:Multidrug resistance protein 2 [Lamellibrachia satsuma]|nr:Multidrug resistance protein 2 [Lamellibrachia satsuma]